MVLIFVSRSDWQRQRTIQALPTRALLTKSRRALPIERLGFRLRLPADRNRPREQGPRPVRSAKYRIANAP
jgi:hypothetical protein